MKNIDYKYKYNELCKELDLKNKEIKSLETRLEVTKKSRKYWENKFTELAIKNIQW